MNEISEDLSASVPDNFSKTKTPWRPGVQASDLRRAPWAGPLEGPAAKRIFWTLTGMLVVMGLIMAIGGAVESAGGLMVAMALGSLATLGVLGFIAYQLWKIANRR